MKIVFFGTPYYVLPILKALHKQYSNKRGVSPIVAVVTQGPKPVGRKKEITYSAVDKWAHEKGIDTFYSSKDLLENNIKADLGICASYGSIIPKNVLDLFSSGVLNIHPSLLPLYRGATPVQSALMDGETEIGCTIFKMDELMDHGPIITQFKEDVKKDDTYEPLRDRMFEKAASVLVDTLPAYLSGKIKLKPQEHKKATVTKMFTRSDGYVDLKKDDSETIWNKYRGLTPWPGIWTEIAKKRVKILKCHLESKKLVIDEVQFEGKNPTKNFTF